MGTWKLRVEQLALVAAILFGVGCTSGWVSDLGTDQLTQGLNCGEGVSQGPHILYSTGAPSRFDDAGTGVGAELLWHCGEVLGPSRVQAIFWGDGWMEAADPIPGMDQFFQGFGSSSYAHLVDEYSGLGPRGVVQASAQVDYSGHWMDPGTLPDHDLTSTEVVAEVCRLTQDAPVANTVYAVFGSRAPDDAAVCGWHASGTCGSGAPVLVLHLPNLSLVNTCDPQDDVTGNSLFLSKLANVTAHELQETVTDPTQRGWIDAAKAEIGDKCAWVFDAPVTFPTGTRWKLQTEWSNAAFRADAGLLSTGGLPGCLQGSP